VASSKEKGTLPPGWEIVRHPGKDSHKKLQDKGVSMGPPKYPARAFEDGPNSPPKAHNDFLHGSEQIAQNALGYLPGQGRPASGQGAFIFPRVLPVRAEIFPDPSGDSTPPYNKSGNTEIRHGKTKLGPRPRPASFGRSNRSPPNNSSFRDDNFIFK